MFTDQELAWIETHPVINIGFDPDWQPLEYIEDGVFKGLSAEYVKAISRVSGLQFRWMKGMSWATARQGILDGTVDVLPAASEALASPQLRKRIAFSAPYFVGSTLIVTQASAPVMFDPNQLSGKKVAVKGGGAYERRMRFKYPDIRLVPVKSPSQALQLVWSGEVYAAVDVDAAFIPLLQQHYFDTLHVAGSIAEMPTVVSIAARIEEPLLISIIDKSLASLNARETDDMMAKWISAENYGPPTWTAILRYYFWELTSTVVFLITVAVLLFRAYQARRRAEHSERDKAMLLAVMSHEIRTPMNAILSSVELLARTGLAPQDTQLANVAVTSANTLLELLDGVLDFSKLEAERLVIQYQPADIRALIKEAVSIAEFRAQEKSLPLKTQLRWETPLWLSVDALRLRQVLLNLLTNAIKFTEVGEVTVTSSFAIEPLDATKGTLRIVVTDTGIGMSKRELQRLFQAFTQADESVTRKFGGTGLGLTICRRLLSLMGGTVELRSVPGKGTTAEVLLPARVVEAQEGADGHDALLGLTRHQAVESTPGTSPKLSVLVVEDHPENQFVIARQLQVLGHEAFQALTGQAGLDQLKQQMFDIILLDCNLPDIDGYTIARRIRTVEDPMGIHTPIIAISAMVGPEHAEACFIAGMDGVLVKPLRLDQLREVIDLWCEVDTLPADESDLESDVATELKQAFFETSLSDLQQIRQAADGSDWLQVSRLAHRIAGAALMLVQPVVVRAARDLEALAKASPDGPGIRAAVEDLQRALADAAHQLGP